MLTTDQIKNIWDDFVDYVETIKAVGGVSRFDVVEGASIPDGFVFDVVSDYYIPANLHRRHYGKKQ